MRTRYLIEMWNPNSNCYTPLWSGDSLEYAEKMFNKPYNQGVTRRLIRFETVVLLKAKANKK